MNDFKWFRMSIIALTAFVAFAALAYAQLGNRGKSKDVPEKAPGPVARDHGQLETATFAAGCFWGVQAKFDEVKGVVKTTAGYTGGTVKNPTYEQVCSHTTGHAEAVQIEFDPAVVSYGQLVDLFWDSHDPTQVDRQGPDVGTNYRSAIFYSSPGQKAIAEASKQKLNSEGKYRGKIATEVVAAGEFYPAEAYHQHYLKKNGFPMCH